MERMRREGIQPNGFMLTSMITAYAKVKVQGACKWWHSAPPIGVHG